MLKFHRAQISRCTNFTVMAGLVPAIHELRRNSAVFKSVVDDRHKGGHDGIRKWFETHHFVMLLTMRV